MIAALALLAAASVMAVRPSGPSVPANLLRISLVFDRPMEEPVASGLDLVDGDGRTIADPFLRQELWSPDGRVLTLLLHPGRVKRGLVAHDVDGPVLVPGETVTLRREGAALKVWAVVPARLAGLDAAAWRLGAPRAGGRSPLVVALDAPLDALGAGLLAIRGPDGRRVAGAPRLFHGETAWRFTPTRPWRAGGYRLVLHPELEDPAGNRVAQAFEHAPASHPAAAASRPFTVR